MPWPTQTTTKDDALSLVDRTAARLKVSCANFRSVAAAGNVNADLITEDLLRSLIVARDSFAAAAAVPGIAAFVAAERSVTQQSVTDNFNAMASAVSSAISWIATNLPKATSGGTQYLAIRTIAADGSMTYRQFAPAETAGLRTALQAVEATIA